MVACSLTPSQAVSTLAEVSIIHCGVKYYELQENSQISALCGGGGSLDSLVRKCGKI